MATEVTPRTRLDPSIFRLPVDRIRHGYYSDAYFVYTKQVLEAEGHHPHVTMQVFQKHDSLLGGIDEALAVLRLCSGYDDDGACASPGAGPRAGPARPGMAALRLQRGAHAPVSGGPAPQPAVQARVDLP